MTLETCKEIPSEHTSRQRPRHQGQEPRDKCPEAGDSVNQENAKQLGDTSVTFKPRPSEYHREAWKAMGKGSSCDTESGVRSGSVSSSISVRAQSLLSILLRRVMTTTLFKIFLLRRG